MLESPTINISFDAEKITYALCLPTCRLEC